MPVPIGRFCRARLVLLFGKVNERFSAPRNPCAIRKVDSIGRDKLRDRFVRGPAFRRTARPNPLEGQTVKHKDQKR